MIKNKKRTAENSTSNDGPVKKKVAKIENKNFNKGNEEKTKNFAQKSKDGAAPDKGRNFAKGKPGKHFTRKPNSGKFDSKNPFNSKFNNKKPMNGKSVPATDEKTDWRKFKQDKKDLKLKRKKSKDSYEICIEAKQIYEKLKCRRSEKKNELVQKLYDLLSGGDTIKKIVMAHDTARIIQCMLKHASPALREQLSEKLMPFVVEMSISKYSHFCVLRMLKYGSPKTKLNLVDSLMGNIVKLACHNISNKILDHIYLTVANPQQKIYMRQELYGELYRKTKDDSIKVLADAYKNTPDMKASILGAVKSNLERIANKQLADSSLVHSVMLEYLNACNDDQIEETVTMYATLIPLMVTTKEGCQAAVICFYKSSSKNRRAIIKNIKEHLVKICNHEHGHIFIIALLNSLDDTKAIKKAIYDNIHAELQTLMSNQYGRRVIEWLISPADTNCFHPTFIATIEEGLQYGKKDKDIRRKEIFEQIEEPISNHIAEHAEFWISDKHIGLVTAEILKMISTTNFVKAANALVKTITDPDWSVNVIDNSKKTTKVTQDVEKIIADATALKRKKQQAAKKTKIVEEVENEDGNDKEDDDDEGEDDKESAETKTVDVTSTIAGIEEAGLHIVLKKIIKHDKERLAKDENSETFGSILALHLTEDTLKFWLTVQRACFILLNIVENNNNNTIEVMKNLLKPHRSTLAQQSGNGAKLLLKKLEL